MLWMQPVPSTHSGFSTPPTGSHPVGRGKAVLGNEPTLSVRSIWSNHEAVQPPTTENPSPSSLLSRPPLVRSHDEWDESVFVDSSEDLPLPEAPPPLLPDSLEPLSLPEPRTPPEAKIFNNDGIKESAGLAMPGEYNNCKAGGYGWTADFAALDVREVREPRESTQQLEDLPRLSYDEPAVTDPIGQCAAALIAKRPATCAFSLLLAFLLPVVIGLCGIPFLGVERLPLQIETTFDSFLQTDVPSSVALHSFKLALANRPGTRRLSTNSAAGHAYYAVKDLTLMYELKEPSEFESSILSKNVLTAISRFERKLRALPKWQELCDRSRASASSLCEPGISLMSYARATWQRHTSEDIMPEGFTFDGGGRDPLNLPTALMFVEQHKLTSLVLPAGTNLTSNRAEVQLLRSVFRFQMYCCDKDSSSVASRREFNNRINDEWRAFMQDDLLPLLEEGPGRGVLLVYDAAGLETLEVHLALLADIWLAMGSVIFVHVYLFWHTRSLLLSLMGPLLAALALPLSFVVCAIVFGTHSVSFASALALFLTVGFGADVIFVYTDFWRTSAVKRRSDADRVAWTFKQGGAASFATTATTALSFFANLASAVRALRQFAFLLGLCLVFAWILISLIYTPLCLVNERMLQWCCSNPKLRSPQRTNARTRALSRIVRTLHFFRYFLVVVSLSITGLFLGFSWSRVKLGTALPRIFAPDHNRDILESLVPKFEPLSTVFGASFTAPQLQEKVCIKEMLPNRTEAAACALHWCMAELAAHRGGSSVGVAAESPWGGGVNCTCWRRRELRNGCRGPVARGVTRMVGLQKLTATQLTQLTKDRFADDNSLPIHADPVSTQAEKLKPLVLQDWLSGSVEVQPFFQAMGRYSRKPVVGWQTCEWEDLCFCAADRSVCELDSQVWQPLPDLQLTAGAAPGSMMRRLKDAISTPVMVEASKQEKVRVGFGLWIMDSSTLLGDLHPDDAWGYAGGFDARDPWTQRIMIKFCEDLPVELRVVYKWCWIEDFRDWLHSRNLRFPPHDSVFDSLALEFADFANKPTRGRKYIWVEENSVRAFFFSFHINIPVGASSTEALENKGHWDRYIKNFQDLATIEGRGTLGIVHVSHLWAQAEAKHELVFSTVVTLAIVLVIAFFGMIVFTRSLILSLYVVISTVQVMIGLMFFIVSIMGWEIGLIEVIAIIYFVGYAVTYSLHVAHKYADPEALKFKAPERLRSGQAVLRYQRTKWALRAIGGAALGSAITTAGASLFLVFCKLTIFAKLGSMCLAVTVMSILTALGPLPAALLMLGPPRPGCCNSAGMAPEREPT